MQLHEAFAEKYCGLLERFRAALEKFIHTREYCRALYWEAELSAFLRSWKHRGILVSDSQQRNLGALLVELVFNYPGVGDLLLQAVLNEDYPLIQGIFLVITLTVLCANLIADVVYLALDPRTRTEAAV